MTITEKTYKCPTDEQISTMSKAERIEAAKDYQFFRNTEGSSILHAGILVEIFHIEKIDANKIAGSSWY